MPLLLQQLPTPLVRAENLEKEIGTKAKVSYKNESVSPPGSHKPNTAVAQLYYNKREGINKLVTEASVLFARTEGILPAPETNHAIKAVIEEAKKSN